ncbi:MAG: adenosine deaminase [Candidatus Abyssobacteria bacterium SURF_17]|uniref:Adenosine deaminase n=1 Tax=Candidatus Abyssobacteria bacterium SURF_17 TaxID=2093361 RepID=A0A419F7Q2_9BACT|nr:MAG: adenosine deaminase [Candidatus Abyssubacteria bacterium SURF_17]
MLECCIIVWLRLSISPSEAEKGRVFMNVARKSNLAQAIEQMPKAELHVHLEGSISHETIEELARKNGIDSYAARGRANPARLRYGHLVDFLEAYRVRCKCLRSADDFQVACTDVLESLHALNVRYAEIMIAPTLHRMNGLSMDEIMPVLARTAGEFSKKNGLEARFILDVGRQFGREHAWQTVREAARQQDSGVIAIGLGGDEVHYSPELFVEQFAWARKQGLHLVAHAGEVGDSASVWGAVNSLGVERIGHGLGARGDEALLETLRIRQIPVDMCPTSNVETGAVRSYADHPLADFLRRGLLVTVNSDDPAMFGTSLTQEYSVCWQELGLAWSELKLLCLNGIRGSFLPDKDKERFLEEFTEELAEIESETGLR